jgi:DNA-binding MarR family transcriptional regulator
VTYLTYLRLRNSCRYATIADVESATIRSSDRELGYRLGAVMLSCFGNDGGAAIRAIDESGLTFTQMKVLMTLAGAREHAPGLKPVAEDLGLSLPSVSRAVDGLVKRELVARTEDPGDRRQRLLEVTPEGDRLAGRIMAARLEGLGRFAASLSDDERDRLDAALELLIERDEIAAVYRSYRKQAQT